VAERPLKIARVATDGAVAAGKREATAGKRDAAAGKRETPAAKPARAKKSGGAKKATAKA